MRDLHEVSTRTLVDAITVLRSWARHADGTVDWLGTQKDRAATANLQTKINEIRDFARVLDREVTERVAAAALLATLETVGEGP